MYRPNPYIAGDPIRAAQGFFGREDIFRRVNNVLKNPNSNAIVLYGQRRIGKTSILLQLANRLIAEGTFTPVYFDLHEKATKPLPALLYDLAVSICQVTGKERPSPPDFDESGDYFRKEFLPSAAEAAAEGGLVLLFDEFDVLDSPSSGQAGQAFFPYLRQWMSEVASVRFVFVIGRRPEDLSTDTHSTFKSIRASRVSLLDRPSAEEVIRQSERAGSLLWSEGAAERLWEICQGHSYLTQLMCSVIYEQIYDTDIAGVPQVQAEIVDQSIPEALEQGANAFHWIWEGLPPAERVVIAAMAEIEKEVVTQEELIERLNQSGVRLIVRELELAPETLVEWELLKEKEGGYGFVVPLLKIWVAKNRPLRRVKDELDRLDPLAEGLFQTGQHFYGLGDFERAQNQLRQSLVINPNHLKSRLLLGRILLETGDAEESSNILEEAFKYDVGAARSDLIKALLALADSPEQDEERRIVHYERILSIDGGQPIARERLALLLNERRQRELQARAKEAKERAAKKDWGSAIAIYQELLREFPDNAEWQAQQEEAVNDYVESRVYLARHYEAKERLSDAAEVYSTLLHEYPDKGDWERELSGVEAHMQLRQKYDQAVGALEQNDLKSAAPLFAEVIFTKPDYKDAARFLLYATKGIDAVKLQAEIVRLQEEIVRLQEVVEIERSQPAGRDFVKFFKSNDPESYMSCPDCGVRVKAKNLPRHYIETHGAHHHG